MGAFGATKINFKHYLWPEQEIISVIGYFMKHPSLLHQQFKDTLKASLDRKRAFPMFLANLSTSVLRLCDENKLTYEAASELCNLSSRYFADIVRGKTAPTILTLEKLCIGFDRTPNQLLIPLSIQLEMSFRTQMQVTQVRGYSENHQLVQFPVCPRCGKTMERDYQSYCDRCGQCLGWKNFDHAAVLHSND